MPDIDFIGYDEAERERLITVVSEELEALEFSEYIVFIRRSDAPSSVVELMTGNEVPFLRIFTRSRDRAEKLTDIFKKHCDVEIIMIGMFTPREE